MIKAVLVLALVALAFAGDDGCNSFQNGNFDAADTVDPWITSPYLAGTSTCWLTGPDQCELLQQNALSGFSNSGRVSVGQRVGTQAPCRLYPDQSVGVNLWQSNIGMCRGLVLSVDVGQQDRRNSNTVTRVPTKFSIVVGRDVFDLNGGTHTEVNSLTIFPATEQPYNLLDQQALSGTWNGPDPCVDICPQTSCYAVGVRIERNENINPNVRQYIDNFLLTDITPPVITVSSQTVQATSCGGSQTVDLGATAVDNCCGDVTIEYAYSDITTENPTATFDVGCHDVTVTATDASGNSASSDFEVCVQQPYPTISCNGGSFQTETCWTQLPLGSSVGATPGINCDGASVTYSPTLDSEFRLGITTVHASFQQGDGLGQETWTAECELDVQFTLCCSADLVVKRSAVPKF